jgi:transposase
MLIVETIGRIRRAHLWSGKSIKEIARNLKISRNTVRRILRSGEPSFSYEREIQPRPKLGRWKGEIDRMLTKNAEASARERLTLIRLFEELRALGYEGGYDAVRRYARVWSREHASLTASAYVPLSFAPGEAYQFDWSHEIVVMDGATTTLKVAHVRLCHSRMMFVRAYPRETQEMVFDAHERAFAFFKGACTRGIYDNMKTAVETIFVGKERQYNRRFLQMCSHHLVDPVACTPASGWEKGQVEEPGWSRPRALLHAQATVQELRRVERLADGPVHRLRQGSSPSRALRANRVGSLRGGAAQAGSLSGSLRWVPCATSLRVEDVPGSVRQQQILGERERGRPSGRGPRLCRARRSAPGWPYRRRASP